MGEQEVLSRDEGSVRILTVNRPKQLNALNMAVLNQLDQEIAQVEQGNAARALVLTGAGEKAFVAGADIKELQALSPLEATDLSKRVQAIFQRLRDLPIPVIASVNGYALGGGLELALSCDFIYASESAVLGLVETDLGLIPGYAGVSRLVDRIGASQAREALFTARKINAKESLQLGLVNRVFPTADLMPETMKVAEQMAQKSPGSIKNLKQLLSAMEDAPEVKATLESQAFGLTFADENAAEGIAAFVEKRKPQFRS